MHKRLITYYHSYKSCLIRITNNYTSRTPCDLFPNSNLMQLLIYLKKNYQQIIKLI